MARVIAFAVMVLAVVQVSGAWRTPAVENSNAARVAGMSQLREVVLVVLWVGLSPFPGVLVVGRVFPSTSGFL